jgi:predicted metal-binding membrane protein
MERILRYDRAPVVTALAALTILSWTYLVILTRDISQGDMRLIGMGTRSAVGGAMGMVMAQYP